MSAPTLITSYPENRDINVNLPAVLAGDLVILCATQDGAGIFNPLPSGWVEIESFYGGGDGQVLRAFYRVFTADQGASTVTMGVGDNTWLVYQYRGVDTTAPIGEVQSVGNHAASGVVTPDVQLTIPAVTTTVADSIVFALFGGDVYDDSQTYTYTTPTGFGNKLSNQENYDTLCAFDKVQAAAGSSGSISCSMNTQGILGIAFVINSVSGGGGGDQNLTLPLIDKTPTIFSPTISVGIALAVPLLTAVATMFAPTLTPGAIGISLPLIDKSPALYSPTISQATNINITMPLLNAAATPIAPAIYPGLGNLRTVILQNDILSGAEGRNNFVSIFIRQPFTVGSGNAIRVVMSDVGWVRTTATTSNMANPFTVTQMYAENGTTSKQISKNGQTSWTVNPGDDDSQCMYIEPADLGIARFVRGTTYWLKMEITLSTPGHTLPFSNGRSTTITSGSQAWWVNKANTTVSAVSAPGVFTYTGTPPDSRQNAYCPYILGIYEDNTDPDTWFFEGDSIQQGQGDVTNYPGGYGVVKRACYNGGVNIISCINFTRIGAATNSFITSPGDRHARWQKYAKHGSHGYGANDFGTDGALDPNTYLATAKTAIAKLRFYGAVKVIAMMLFPRTSSSDSWRTLANQTAMGVGWVAGGNAQQYNALLAAEVGVTIDAVVPMNSGRDSVETHKWPVNGSANYGTIDGTHPSSVIHISGGAEYRGVMDSVTSINLALPLLNKTPTLFAPTISIGDLTISMPLLNNGSQLFSPTIVVETTVSLPLLDKTPQLFAPILVVDGGIGLPLLDKQPILFAPTLTFGPVSISLPLIESVPVIIPPVVSVGGIIVQVPLINNEAVLFSPNITVGDITISVPLFDKSPVLFAPQIVVVENINLLLPLINSTAVLYPPRIFDTDYVYYPDLTFVIDEVETIFFS